MSFPLSGRVAAYISASCGIGEATATQLAAHCAKRRQLARRADRLDAPANHLALASGTALSVVI